MARVQRRCFSFKNIFVFSVLLGVMVIPSRMDLAQYVAVEGPITEVFNISVSEPSPQPAKKLPKAWVWKSKSHSFDSMYRSDR